MLKTSKKAFTLVELLAVIVILSVLAVIVVLNVSDYLDEASETSYNTLVESIKSSTELYVAEHSSLYPQLDTPGSTFNIYLSDLVADKYVSSNLIDERTGTTIPLTTPVTITVVDKNKINVTFTY